MNPDRVAYKGPHRTLIWAITLNGRLPAKEFFESLSPKDKARVLHLFKVLGDTGHIPNKEQFKKLEGTDLFEFKEFQIRLIGKHRPGGVFLLAHGLRKKKNKHKASDIAKAIRILAECDEIDRKGTTK